MFGFIAYAGIKKANDDTGQFVQDLLNEGKITS